jgi:hypothetical protein
MPPQSTDENAPPSFIFQQLSDGTPDMSQVPKENTPPQRVCSSPSFEDQLLKNPEQEDLKGTVGISIYPFMPNFH